MELQFFDTAGAFRFRVNRRETLWSVLDAGPGPIAGDELERLVDRLEAEVRRLRAALPSELPTGGYDESPMDVLGETLRANARDPDVQALRRAIRIYEPARSTLDAGLGLYAIAPPDLSREQFRVARILKDTDERIPKRALPALVEHLLDERLRSATDDGARAELERERAGWGDPETLERVVADLEAAGLVGQEADGTVRPTHELRLMLI
jgi:hypothetical protein